MSDSTSFLVRSPHLSTFGHMGEVYLYHPGGTVTARLRQGGGGLDGALSKSGASLTLAR